MIKAEPRSILYFIWNYFDIVKELFVTQSKEGIIRKETLVTILDHNKREIKGQLLEYKIIRPVNDDYELRDVYYKLVEFVLYEFRPLLPEEIEKFGLSISELFRKIKDGITQDKEILSERLKSLTKEIKEFTDAIEKNSIRLLNETRELKSNVTKIDYREKIRKASFWIEYYIIPLNTILDVNHSESITNRLSEVSQFANEKRLNFKDERIRQLFEQLYFLLIQTHDDLLRQSRLLTNELLPLVERVRTESLIITGWIELLRNPYKTPGPRLLRTDKNNPYSSTIFLNTKEYFEQFTVEKDAILDQDDTVRERWIFNKSHYRKRLSENLPIGNFFEWCDSELKDGTEELTSEKVFALTSLLFENEVEVSPAEKTGFIQIKTKTSTLFVPVLNITKNGVS